MHTKRKTVFVYLMSNTIKNSANTPGPSLKLDSNGVSFTQIRSTSLNHLEEALGVAPRSISSRHIMGSSSITLWCRVNGKDECVDVVSLRRAGVIA